MEHCRPERRSGPSTNVCERTDEPSCLPAEVMCRVQREKTWHSGRRGCILSPYQANVESRMGAGALSIKLVVPFPIPAHQTRRADFPHRAFRPASSSGPRSRFRDCFTR